MFNIENKVDCPSCGREFSLIDWAFYGIVHLNNCTSVDQTENRINRKIKEMNESSQEEE